MDPERWQRVARLYEATLEQEPEHRDAFLADASDEDVELRREVESLLAQDAVPLLIDRPMLEAAAPILDEEATIAGGTQLVCTGSIGSSVPAGWERSTRNRHAPQSHGGDQGLAADAAMDVQSRERFDREAKAIAAIDPPSHLHAPRRWPPATARFLVMEYLEGETLAARLETGPLPVDQALTVRDRDRRCADDGAPARNHPSRSEARQHHAHERRGKAARLRTGEDRARSSSAATASWQRRLPAVTAQGTIVGTLSTWRRSNSKAKDADARRTSSRSARSCTRC